jgi:hypothetical protein
MDALYPAEHRALRELYVAARTVERHWARLAGASGQPELLREGAEDGQRLREELKARIERYGLFGTPAAQAAGTNLAAARGLSDRLLERNQALRGALLELYHAATLLGYLAALARTRGDAELAAWHHSWELHLLALGERGRDALAALAADPEGAIVPADDGVLGRAGHTLNAALGTLGEAIDTRFGHRR